ncbi:hypothetical protein CK623_05495 [Vandammella animalimorsus]|uniref:DUF1631 family protein n=1 Tax=Vandammella animalimorsus TaxID=2029117 RepID=A0A2A2AS41_9BURK|nr:DUF1631 family protein [Vandammella animalimorsus]PAT40541.1 hypothetical protein CK623_05495 [Vandammella animalimorsus]
MVQNQANWPIFRSGVIEALRESSGLIRRVLRDTGARVAQNQEGGAGPGNPQLISKALRWMDLHHEQWVQAYPGYLLQAFSEVLEFDPYSQDDEIISGLGDIDLHTTFSIQSKSDLMHVHRTLEAAVENALERLDGLVSAARGYDYIRSNRNPLRPENYLHAMQKMLEASEGEEIVRVLILKSFAAALAPALNRTYFLLTNQMSEAGIESVQKRATGFGAMTTGFGDVSYLQASATDPAAERLLTREELLDGLGADAAHYMLKGKKPRQAATAQDHAEPGAVASPAPSQEPARPAQAAAPMGEAEQGKLDSLQDLLLAVVKDVAHLQPLKEIVAQLQPCLRRLVQNDPAFLRDPHHPARLFLSKIQAGAKQFAHVESPGCQDFLRRVASISATGRLGQARSAEPFKLAYAQLQAGEAGAAVTTAAAAQTTQAGARAATPAPAAAARPAPSPQAQALFDAVVARAQALPFFAAADPWVQKFIAGPWAKVIVRAILRQEPGQTAGADVQALLAKDPRGYAALVPLLLTSVQAQYLRQAEPGLLHSIAEMHQKLHVGLLSVGVERSQAESVIAKLKKLHHQALAAAAPASGRPPDQPAGSAALPKLTHEHMAEAASPAAPQAEGASQLPDALQQMRVGQWYMIGETGQPLRTQLTWANPERGLMMFTSADGSNQTMTYRRLVQLYQQGHFAPLDES